MGGKQYWCQQCGVVGFPFEGTGGRFNLRETSSMMTENAKHFCPRGLRSFIISNKHVWNEKRKPLQISAHISEYQPLKAWNIGICIKLKKPVSVGVVDPMNSDVFNAQCQLTGGSMILQSHRPQQGTAALLMCRYVDPKTCLCWTISTYQSSYCDFWPSCGL